MKIQRPIGTYDLSPDETAIWSELENRIRDLFRRYNYGEIRTPIFEYTDLFKRGVGESSDIVSKEMYTFDDRGGRSLTLRPEGTAGVVRAYLENSLGHKIPGVTKLFYIAPMFRYERKQKGRFRQHVQYGCEVLDAAGPDIDIEILVMLNQFYTELGLDELDLKINSVGSPECRPAYRDILVEHVKPNLEKMCDDCHRRFETNPLRMFDCKSKTCQGFLKDAPKLTDHLDEESAKHFAELREGLEKFSIAYEIDPHLVRGLDYYTRTAFEMSYAPLGSQGVLVGGGRYDGLVQYLGGQPTTGIGFGAGLERLLLILRDTKKELTAQSGIDLFFVILGERAAQKAPVLMYEARKAGFRCERDFAGKSMRKQFQLADKLNARFAAVIGDDELDKHVIVLKDFSNGTQKEIPWSDDLKELIDELG